MGEFSPSAKIGSIFCFRDWAQRRIILVFPALGMIVDTKVIRDVMVLST